MDNSTPQISVVIPVLNERGNLGPLVDEIDLVLYGRVRFEIIVVDDASTDGTADEVERIAAKTGFVRLLRHEHTRGQSAAIRTGVKVAAAPVVAVLDGDGQNDPRDIPKLFGPLMILRKVRMVVGHRQRRDVSGIRRVSSRIANAMRNAILHDGIRDTGCGLKVFYRDDFLELPAFDHMHRFLPALMKRNGAAIYTVPVNHRPRLHGRSKYGTGSRLWAGITDLFGVLWLQKRIL